MTDAIVSVYQRFAVTAAVHPQADSLWVEPVTAAAYGIAAGAIRWGAAQAEVFLFLIS